MTDANTYSVWNYGCALETESPRFTIPGEFFTYIVFVGSMILVSVNSPLLFKNFTGLIPHPALNVFLLFLALLDYFTSRICPPSQHLAEAVPEDEEDYPCISPKSIIRNQSKRTWVRCEHGGNGI